MPSDTELDEKLTKLEEKLDLFLQHEQATQRAIALLKADFREIVKESIYSVLHNRAVEGYSKIAGGRK